MARTKRFTRRERRRITAAVARAESATSGEIRVEIVNDTLLPVRDFALKQFKVKGLHKTRDKTGVLILVVMEKRVIEVVADKGINDKVPQSTWDDVVRDLAVCFRQRAYLKGILAAVETVGEVLTRHFPKKTDDTDELSNEPIVEA